MRQLRIREISAIAASSSVMYKAICEPQSRGLAMELPEFYGRAAGDGRVPAETISLVIRVRSGDNED
ncbi:hypothetical protein C5748_19280 [Phyllobacterium phragmitis]|uniref:Uncharacterized protein n=1 Tax=Phyllobacterium phragmitis TaxID=2670329 RepID=A0A2S9IMP4_9HYPH|nr:hypothetical protein C5748_19280 [Phyllobacterium phragmitis]